MREVYDPGDIIYYITRNKKIHLAEVHKYLENEDAYDLKDQVDLRYTTIHADDCDESEKALKNKMKRDKAVSLENKVNRRNR